MNTLRPLPPSFTDTRSSMHALAEHVLCVARYKAEQRFVLRPGVCGIETPPVGERGSVFAVESALNGADIVVRELGSTRRAPITNMRRAAEFLGISAGLPPTLWQSTTPLELDAPLSLDAESIRILADWYAFTENALSALIALRTPSKGSHLEHSPSDDSTSDEFDSIKLFPEHFDLATNASRVNYGGSPGDSYCEEPYLYVGPFDRPFPDDGAPPIFWNAPFGAVLRYSEIQSLDSAVDFFARGRERCASQTSKQTK